MENLNSLKSSGIKKLQSKKYTDAIIDFTQVVDGLANPSSTEEISLKSTCLINRATCNLLLCQHSQRAEEQQKYIQKCIDDATFSITVLNKSRAEEKTFEHLVNERKYDELINDPLTHLYALSNLRLGEASETLANPSKAFHYYSLAFNSEYDPANPKGNRNQEAKKAIRELLVRFYNAPDVKPSNGNSILQAFFVIKNELARKEVVGKALMEIFMNSFNYSIPDGILKTIDSSKYCNLLYAIIELYNDQQMNLQASVILHVFSTHQFKSVFTDYLIFKRLFEHSFSDVKCVNEFVQCLKCAPREYHPVFIDNGFIPLVMRTFELGDKISDKFIDNSFDFLFKIVEAPSRLPYIIGDDSHDDFHPPILKYIEERKTPMAACLLSKLTQDSRIIELSQKNRDFVWITDIIKTLIDSKDPNFIEANETFIKFSIVYFSRILLANTDEQNIEFEKNHAISDLFDLVVVIAKGAMKNRDLVSVCFSFFTLSARYVPEKIREHKLITMASLYLHLLNDFPAGVQNVISFLYEAADKANLLDELKACPKVLDNVMLALHQHIDKATIVERGVAIGCLLDHPNKHLMLADSLDRFPNDPFLLQIKERFDKE